MEWNGWKQAHLFDFMKWQVITLPIPFKCIWLVALFCSHTPPTWHGVHIFWQSRQQRSRTATVNRQAGELNEWMNGWLMTWRQMAVETKDLKKKKVVFCFYQFSIHHQQDMNRVDVISWSPSSSASGLVYDSLCCDSAKVWLGSWGSNGVCLKSYESTWLAKHPSSAKPRPGPSTLVKFWALVSKPLCFVFSEWVCLCL